MTRSTWNTCITTLIAIIVPAKGLPLVWTPPMPPGISRTTAPTITVLANDGRVGRTSLSKGAATRRRAFASTPRANSVVRKDASLGTPVMRWTVSLTRRQSRYASAMGCVRATRARWSPSGAGLIVRPGLLDRALTCASSSLALDIHLGLSPLFGPAPPLSGLGPSRLTWRHKGPEEPEKGEEDPEKEHPPVTVPERRKPECEKHHQVQEEAADSDSPPHNSSLMAAVPPVAHSCSDHMRQEAAAPHPKRVKCSVLTFFTDVTVNGRRLTAARAARGG